MNINISTLDDLEQEAQFIQDFLEEELDEDGARIVAYNNKLIVYIARTGKMLADAKLHQNRATKNSIFDELKKDLSLAPSTFNKLISSYTEKENYLVNWLERLNNSATKKLEWNRSIISKLKAEQQLTN